MLDATWSIVQDDRVSETTAPPRRFTSAQLITGILTGVVGGLAIGVALTARQEHVLAPTPPPIAEAGSIAKPAPSAITTSAKPETKAASEADQLTDFVRAVLISFANANDAGFEPANDADFIGTMTILRVSVAHTNIGLERLKPYRSSTVSQIVAINELLEKTLKFYLDGMQSHLKAIELRMSLAGAGKYDQLGDLAAEVSRYRALYQQGWEHTKLVVPAVDSLIERSPDNEPEGKHCCPRISREQTKSLIETIDAASAIDEHKEFKTPFRKATAIVRKWLQEIYESGESK